MIRLWETGSGACLRILHGDRRYERVDITGLAGVTAARGAARSGRGRAATATSGWDLSPGIGTHVAASPRGLVRRALAEGRTTELAGCPMTGAWASAMLEMRQGAAGGTTEPHRSVGL